MAKQVVNQFNKRVLMDDDSLFNLVHQEEPDVAILTIKSKQGISGDMKLTKSDLKKIALLCLNGFSDMDNEQAIQ